MSALPFRRPAFNADEPLFFVQVPEPAIEDPNLTDFEYRLLSWLTRWIRSHPGTFPTMNQAARSLGKSRSTISRAYRGLAAAGYILLDNEAPGRSRFSGMAFRLRTPTPRAAKPIPVEPQIMLPLSDPDPDPEPEPIPESKVFEPEPELVIVIEPEPITVVAVAEPIEPVEPVEPEPPPLAVIVERCAEITPERCAEMTHPAPASIKERAGFLDSGADRKNLSTHLSFSSAPQPRPGLRSPLNRIPVPPDDVIADDPILRAEAERREQAKARAKAKESG